MIKRIAIILVAVLAVFSFVSCDSDLFGSKEPTDITISDTLLEFNTMSEVQGKNLQLSATATMKDGSTSTDIVWIDMPSDITAFKTVSTSKGVLTFQILKAGTYVVTAGVKYKDKVVKTAQCVITIKDALTKIDISSGTSTFNSKTLSVGDTLTLETVYSPSTTSQTGIVWGVDNADILSVEEQPQNKAIIKGLSAGTAIVTATSKENNTISDSVTIQVVQSGETQKLPVSRVEFSSSVNELKVGEKINLSTEVYDGNGNPMSGGTVQFSVSDKSLGTLSNSSNRTVSLTALKGGELTVLATYTSDGNEVTSEIPLTITGDLEGFGVESNYINLAVNEENVIKVSYSPDDVVENRKGFTYEVDSQYLQVLNQNNNEIKIRALKEGTTTIKIKSLFNDFESSVVVNVKAIVTEADRIQKITLNKNSLSFTPSTSNGKPSYNSFELKASVYRRNDDGEYEVNNNKLVDWSVSDDSIVELIADGNTATLNPKKPGTVVVTARSRDNESVYSQANVVVNGQLQTLLAEHKTINLVGGDSTEVKLVAVPSYAIYSAPEISTDNDYVHVTLTGKDNNYVLKIRAEEITGKSTINVYVDGKIVETVTVNIVLAEPIKIRTISLSDASVSLDQDSDPYYVTVTLKDKNGAKIESLTDDIVVTPVGTALQVAQVTEVKIDLDGQHDFTSGYYITPMSSGSADYVFSYPGTKVETRLHIEVGASPVVQPNIRLKANIDSLSLIKGKFQQVELNVLPFGTEFKEKIAWTVSNGSVASVSGNGLKATITALSAGNTVVTAESDSGLTAKINVVVTEEAKVEDTSISYVTITSGGSQTHLVSSKTGESISLTATAYKADGTVVSNEAFEWDYSGTAATMINTSGNIASMRTVSYGGYDAPAVVTATSVSNPNAKASFKVFVVLPNTVVEEENVKFLFSCDAITLEKGTSKSVSYSYLPVTYTGNMTVKTSNDCVELILNRSNKTVTVSGKSAGTATVTLTDGDKNSASFNVTVVEKAEKVDTSITTLTLDRSYLSYDIATKALQTITATVYKDGKASQEGVVWSVSDSSLVSLTENGNAVLVSHKNKVGTVTITAKAKNNSEVQASCLVEIVDTTQIAETLRYVMLSETVVELSKGESVTLTASGNPSSLFKDTLLTWKSSNENIAIVSNGKVKALDAGEAIITVTAEDKSATCRIIVSQETPAKEVVQNIVLSETLMDISQEDMDQVFNVTASVISATGNKMTNRAIDWTVNDPNDAIEYNTAYDSFSFTPKSAGTAIVTATVDNVSSSVKIIVGEAYIEDEELQRIYLYPTNLTLEENQTFNYPVRVSTVPVTVSDNFSWTTNNPSIVSIAINSDKKSAILRGLEAGNATITVYSIEHPEIAGTMNVTVKAKETIAVDEVTAVVLDKTSVILDMAEKNLTFVKATVYKNGKVSDAKVKWTIPSSAKNVVNVLDMGNNTIVLTKKGLGEETITATSVDDSNFSASFIVQVIDSTEIAKTKLVSATLSSSAISLEEGSDYTFSVKTIPSDIEPVIQYSVSNESVAKIEANGKLTALSKGNATVKAVVTYNDQSITLNCVVSVYEKAKEEEEKTIVPVASYIRFSDVSVYLSQEKMDETKKVTATVYDGTFTKMDSVVSWTIEDPSVASITSNGNEVIVAPLTAGKTYVNATYKNITNKFAVVVGAQSQALAEKTTQVLFENDSIVMGKNEVRSVKANCIPAGLGDKVTYTINDPSIVKISINSDNTVTLTALSAGTATLTAISINNPTLKDTMTIKVVEDTTDVVTSLKLDKNYITLAMDEKALTELKATVYVNGNVSKNTNVTWSLDGLTTSQLTYTLSDSYGSSVYLTKKAVGSGYLVATAGDVSARCFVEIVASGEALKLNDIILSDESISLKKKESYSVKATLVPSNIVTTIDWTTSDNTIATVNSNGTITAVSEGVATITAHSYAYNVSKEIKVTVLADEAKSVKASFIRLNVQEVELSQTDGKTVDVVATVFGEDGFAVSGATVTWAMDKENIASMKVSGNTVTLGALNTGRTTLRAYYGNLSTNATVYVGMVPGEDIKTLDHITLTPSVLTIQTGTEGVVTASSFPAGLELNIDWQSQDTTIATAKANGLSAYITGVKQGSTTITATDKGTEKASSIKVRVLDDISTAVTMVEVDKESLTLDLNSEDPMAEVNAKVYIANTYDSNAQVEWKFYNDSLSSAGDAVTLTDLGDNRVAVRASKTGSGYLRATSKTDSEMYAQLYVRVIDSKTIIEDAKITELRLEYDNLSMKKGTTRQIKCVTTPSYLTADVRWTVAEGASVVSVDIYGNVTAKAKGSAVVKAYLADNTTLSDTVSITVTEDEVTPDTDDPEPTVYDIGAISINPSSAILSQEATFPTSFTAKVYDKKGNVLNEENVEWVTDELNDVATVARTEGNVIYLKAKNAGNGTLTAKRTAKDGTVVSKSIDIYTGALPSDPEKATLEALTLNTSSPVYMLVDDSKTINVSYRPNSDEVKGVNWSFANESGVISSVMDDNKVVLTALTKSVDNVTVTATSVAKTSEGKSLSQSVEVKVAENVAELPSVTSLVLDKTAIILNLAERYDLAVTATGYDYYGNEVKTASITWALEDNKGTEVSLANNIGTTVGLNKGTKTGTVNLVATCGDVKAVCAVSVIDSTQFSGISLSSDTVYLNVGNTFTITVSGTPSTMFTGANAAVSGNTSAISVSQDSTKKVFTITALQSGTSIITFTTTVNGVEYKAKATVYVNVEESNGVQKIVVDTPFKRIAIGESFSFTARLYDKKGNEVFSDIEFELENAYVANMVVNDNNVNVTGLSAGDAIVHVRSGEIESSVYVTVYDNSTVDPDDPVIEDKSLKKIIPAQNKITLKNGEKYTMAITTDPEDAKEELSVMSSKITIVKAELIGRNLSLTATGIGSATVTLTYGDIVAVIDVTVKGEATPAIIKLNKNEISFNQTAGQSETVTAIVYDSEGEQVANPAIVWTMDNPDIVKVTELGNGTVALEPLNYGTSYVWANLGSLKAGLIVKVNEKTSSATSLSNIETDTPKLILRVGDSSTVSVLYAPTGVTEAYKAVNWAISDPTIAQVDKLGIGDRVTVTGLKVGKATVTGKAVSGVGISTSMDVEVVADTVDVYAIELNKTDVRLDQGTSTFFNATLTKNGESIPANDVLWTFESNDAGVKFVDGGTFVNEYTGSQVAVNATNKSGTAMIVATYENASARAQVTVEDLSIIEDVGIRSVNIEQASLLMEVGEYYTFNASVLPEVTGVTYEWTQKEIDGNDCKTPYVSFIAKSGSSVTVRAEKAGQFSITLQASLEGFDSKTDSVTVDIVEKGASEVTYKYSAVKMSTNSLDLAQSSNTSTVSATLIGSDKEETTDSIRKWALLDERGKEIFTWEDDEFLWNDNTYLSFSDMVNAGFDSLGSFSVVGSDNRQVNIIPGKAGIYFLQAYGPEEGTAEAPFSVSAKTMLNVSGTLSAISFNSSYIHMIKGATQVLGVTRSPSTATLKEIEGYSWSTPELDEGVKVLSLSEQGEYNATVTAENVGTSTVTYTATDINGNTKSDTATIVVHDPSWGTGGIKQISFPSSFATFNFPYSSQTFKASAYYMDGTTAEDTEIEYEVQALNSEKKWTAVSDNKVIVNDTVIATYSAGKANNDITITPIDKGNFRVVAKLEKKTGDDTQNYESVMYVTIGGDSNNISASSSSIVLYTGGSSVISLSTDNPSYADGYKVDVLSEYTATGYLIENNRIATGETVDSALKEPAVIGDTITFGAKTLITNKVTQDAFKELQNDGVAINTDDFIGWKETDFSSEEFIKLLETFPRTATVRVSTKDGESYTDINIQINRLPQGNTYPVAISLDQEKVDLNPPFEDEQTLTATLYDQTGVATSGTVNWYFYPIGTKDYTSDTYLLSDADDKISNEYLSSAYFNGKTLYYVPKKAGIYRVTVTSAQNPQLSYTSTLNISGDVTAVSASTGSSLAIAKNNTAEISAVFTPSNALARDVFFTVDKNVGSSSDAKYISMFVDNNNGYSNDYLRALPSASTLTVTGLKATGNDVQRIRILYPKTTEDAAIIEQYLNGSERLGVKMISKETFVLVKEDGDIFEKDGKSSITFNAYYYTVNVSVTVSKAIYSFSTTSNRTINPSSLENGKIAFDMLASGSSSDNSTVSPFSRWDWIECRIVGDESGLVYASSVPVDEAGHSLYSEDGKWYYYTDKDGDGKDEKYETTSDGKYYNYKKTEYFYKPSSASGKESYPVILSGGTAYYVDDTYTKRSLTITDTTKSLSSLSNNETINVTTQNEKGLASGTITCTKTSVSLATKAGDSSGKLDTDNGGSTFFFKLNTAALSDETLRIVVRLRDDVKNCTSVDTYNYDPEATQIDSSNLALAIGGRLISLSTGTVIRSAHGSLTNTETLTKDIQTFNLYEGASVTLIPTFNPSSTHETEIEWEVTGKDMQGNPVGDSTLKTWVTYGVTSGTNFQLTANAFGTIESNDHRFVYVTARSKADPSIYCQYEIDVQTHVKSLNFSAVGQIQTNKNVTSGTLATPIYRNATTSIPTSSSASEIYCYDSTDSSGGGGVIDAFYISYQPVPDYGYDFTVEVVKNTMDASTTTTKSTASSTQIIGTIDTTGIEEEEKAFRFLPTGRVYEQYDENGNGLAGSSYSVAYGDVKLRIYNDAINYSKNVTIHFLPTSYRLVKYVKDLDYLAASADGKYYVDPNNEDHKEKIANQWDYLWSDSAKLLQGLECVVLYKGEEISLSFAGVSLETSTDSAGNAVNTTKIENHANNEDITVTWSVLQKRGGDTSELISAKPEKDGRVVTITGDNQGVYYLQYSLSYPLKNADGSIITVTSLNEAGEEVTTNQEVQVVGGIPVYVISDIDQELVRLTENTDISALIPERISRGQIDKWYGVAKESGVTNEGGSTVEGLNLYFGKTYAVFDEKVENSFVNNQEVVSLEEAATGQVLDIKLQDPCTQIFLNSGSFITTALNEELDEYYYGEIINKKTGKKEKDVKISDLVDRTYADVKLEDLTRMSFVSTLSITEAPSLKNNYMYDILGSNDFFADTKLNSITLEATNAQRGIDLTSLNADATDTNCAVSLQNLDFAGNTTSNSNSIVGSNVTLNNIGFNGNVKMAGTLSLTGKADSVYNVNGTMTSVTLGEGGNVTLSGSIGEMTIDKGKKLTSMNLTLKGCKFNSPSNLTFPAGSTFSFEADSDCANINKISANNCTINKLDIDARVEEISITNAEGNTSLAIGNDWNNWNVDTITVTNTLSGDMQLKNSKVTEVNLANNLGLTGLILNCENAIKVDASNCSLYSADIQSMVMSSNASLNLANNKFTTVNPKEEKSWIMQSGYSNSVVISDTDAATITNWKNNHTIYSNYSTMTATLNGLSSGSLGESRYYYVFGSEGWEDCDECTDGWIKCQYCDKDVTCSYCNGTGMRECHVCGGTTKVPCTNSKCSLGKVTISGTRKTTCPYCINGYFDCGICDGKGYLECPDCDGGTITVDPCDTCNGKGEASCGPCTKCSGKGKYQASQGVYQGCGSCGGSGIDNTHTGYSNIVLGSGKKYITCPICNGDGYYTIDCDTCGGDGKIACTNSNCDDGQVDCPNCDGGERETSYSYIEDCSVCDGEGELTCTACEDYRNPTYGWIDPGHKDCSTCDGTGQVHIDAGDCDTNQTSGGYKTYTCTNNGDSNGNVECPVCEGKGQLYVLRVTEYLYRYQAKQELKLFGNTITTEYSALNRAPDGDANENYDFAKEWRFSGKTFEGLVNLSNNEIKYELGWGSSKSYDKWIMNIKVHFTAEGYLNIKTGEYINDEKHIGNGEYDYYGYLNSNGSSVRDIGKTEDNLNATYKVNKLNLNQYNETSLELYRDINESDRSWFHDNDEPAIASWVEIHPFG
jgi:uncharacterized protein YjdB